MDARGTYEIIMPVEDVAYAACKRPTQKDQPSGQPVLFSKCVNTQSALLRPSCATMSAVRTTADMPAKVQMNAAACLIPCHRISQSVLQLLSSSRLSDIRLQYTYGLYKPLCNREGGKEEGGGFIRTSSQGSHLFPNAETPLLISVTATKIRYT